MLVGRAILRLSAALRCVLSIALLFASLPLAAGAQDELPESVELPPEQLERSEAAREPGPSAHDPAQVVPATTEEPGAPSPSAEPPKEADARWSPLLPENMKKDWARLISGEWLRGDIVLLRDEELEFESDELDTQSLDWDDVLELHSPRLNTWVFEGEPEAGGRRYVRGASQFERIASGVVKDGKVRLMVDGKQQVHPRRLLLAIIPGAPREINYWSFEAGFGLGAQAGNTDELDVSLSAKIKREGPTTRSVLEYRGAVGTLDGVENTNNHRGSAKLDWYLSRRFYVTPLYLEAFHDRFQNIRLRLTPGSGVGYNLLDSKRIDWHVELGLAGQYLQNDSLEAGDPNGSWNGVVRLGTGMESEITSRVDLDFDYRFDLAFPDTGASSHHSTSELSVELTKIIDLDVTFVFDRTDDPAPDADGEVPEKNDLRLTVGFSLEY